MADRALTDRTLGEELWLWRRRAGLRQDEAATRLGVSKYCYGLWETDRAEGAPWRRIKPSAGDLCALARRRHERDLRSTASLLGCTHVTLLARERRSDPALVEGWRALGYQF